MPLISRRGFARNGSLLYFYTVRVKPLCGNWFRSYDYDGLRDISGLGRSGSGARDERFFGEWWRPGDISSSTDRPAAFFQRAVPLSAFGMLSQDRRGNAVA